MLSQFFILSPRGDTIIIRDFLGNVSKVSSRGFACYLLKGTRITSSQSAPEVFFRKFKFWDGGEQDAPPVFIVDGTTYLHTRDGGLHLVATSRENVSPSLVLELLKRVGSIIRVCPASDDGSAHAMCTHCASNHVCITPTQWQRRHRTIAAC